MEKHVRLAYALLSLITTACVFPGGELRGTVATGAVDDWSFTDAVKTVQLETRPGAPHSINIWGVSTGDAFYVASDSWRQRLGGSGGDARWVGHIAIDPRVRLRVGRTLYERKAIRVQDEAELARFRQAYQKKYDSDPWEREDPPWVYRLDPR